MERNQDDELSKIVDKFGENLTLDSSTNNHELKHDEVVVDDDDDDVHVIDDDFEFPIAGGELHSPVSADEAFLNGQIRPISTFSDDASATPSYAPPVKRLFVVSTAGEEEDDAAGGEYCAWTPATEMSRKSNSTGFSRLWRMKDLLVRSNSDGKDTFVFLPSSSKEVAQKKEGKKVRNNNAKTTSSSSSTTNVGNVKEEKKKGKKAATVTSSVAAYEALYLNKEKRKGGGGKSYLPYRVGFFTNVNGFTQNVHPY
ncbi:hypothetical protein RND81_02G237500 [Saponaria officinalis]|uniref:Uncharacterized protein n=1 Tax=Saponaria officinalis TaxID=3572 RepID=A0AAW1MZW6_SAPOF